ncbi:hypothetical protein L917_07118 [Phytophthora nicotianae]|uniref:Uncharacterized protein n=1 Tax=Phytophthora nicotianae TaxID=4792 RepID=W2J658_PHYNI|nr:hypothetical protein L916_07224 [Phytophthora nicotianae]ETL95010.1 hypothetical protein L917_07118 [Phytophthora nicotianae]
MNPTPKPYLGSLRNKRPPTNSCASYNFVRLSSTDLHLPFNTLNDGTSPEASYLYESESQYWDFGIDSYRDDDQHDDNGQPSDQDMVLNEASTHLTRPEDR